MRRTAWLLILAVPFVAAIAAETPATIPPPLRAPGDQSEFRHVVLDNGLRVILFSNPKLNFSSVALAVDTGSLNDPVARPGLAHYLEHLLFLGTDKFPDTGEFDKYIQAAGGTNNAYTASDHTNYHLQISHAAFEGALERLSRFFIAPRFDADFCSREVTAIENEYQRHRDNDLARLEFVSNELYAPGSPDAHFSIGNRATLAGTPREEVIAFYKAHYSADHMALALCGPGDLDRLEALARRYFSEIPRRPVAPAEQPRIEYLPTKPALRLAQIVSAKDDPRLFLQFPVGPTRPIFAAKPIELLGALLSDGSAGSLLAQLKAENLALSINSELDDRAADHGAFYTTIHLTAKGRENMGRVLQLFFAYVRMLQASPYPLTTFREHAEFARRDEAFVDRGEGMELAANLVHSALQYPLEVSERVSYLWLTPDETAYRSVLGALQPDNLLAALLAPDAKADRKEKYYGFAYGYSEDSGALYAGLKQTTTEKIDFHLPDANPFATANTSVLAVEPVAIVDEPGLRMLYAQESDLARPQVAYRFYIRPGKPGFTAADAAQLALFQSVLKFSLQDLEADASAAGIQFSIEARSGLVLSVSGYSAATERFLEQLIQRMTQPSIDERGFSSVHEHALATLSSFPNSEAVEIGQARYRCLVERYSFFPTGLLEPTRRLTRQQVLETLPALFATAQVDGLACGNVSPSEAARIAHLLHDRLSTTAGTKAGILRPRYLNIAAGETIVDAATISGPNSFVQIVYRYPSDAPEYRAAAGLIGLFIGDDFFADLRTHQQLGYIVAANSIIDSPLLFTFSVVQSSEYPSDELRRRIEAYFGDLGRRWSEVTPEHFAQLREGLRAQLQTKPNKILERSEIYFQLANDFSEHWQQTAETLAALDRLTPERVGKIIAELLAPATRRVVVEQLTSTNHTVKTAPQPSFTDRDAWKAQRTW
jgi:secreted Zn-dependent insulinase-like peptidase